MSQNGDSVLIPDRAGRNRRRAGLAVRLMAAMGVALLPLAVLSYRQALETEHIAEARARAAILGDTLVAATPQIDAILRGTGVAAGLAAVMPSLIHDPTACSKALAEAQAQSSGDYSFISYLELDSSVRCASDGKSHDFSDTSYVKKWLEDPRPLVDINLSAPISGSAIVVFSHPVRDTAGQVTGFVTISAPHAGVVDLSDAQTAGRANRWHSEGKPNLALLTFDAAGTVLTSSLGLDKAASILPLSRPLSKLTGQFELSFIDTTQDGESRAFGVVPLAPGKLYLLGSWPSDRLESGYYINNMPSFVFPILMWAASLLVAWIAAEALVIRHVRSLRKSITTFARGDRRVLPLQFEGAASELRDVGDAYEAMTTAILHDEADLENTIHQKEVLLREVHHRVKNNLQLIASILNMQIRSAQAPETRDAMRNVQERVMSLATIHRELYQTSGLTDVRADELLPQIVAQILRIGSAPGRRVNITTDIEAIRLTPDQAVPLSLFLTEAMANVMKHGAAGAQAGGRVSLAMKEGGKALFTLTNPVASDALTHERKLAGSGIEGRSDGFGSQLLQAFARQLDGIMESSQTHAEFTLTLLFPVRPLTDAEERADVAAGDVPAMDESADHLE